jgi:hypothetical protein
MPQEVAMMLVVGKWQKDKGVVEINRRKILLTKKGRWLVSSSGVYSFDAKTLKPTARTRSGNYTYRLEEIS